MDFSTEQIEEIVASRETDGEIAKRFGSHHKTIAKIRREHAEEAPGEAAPEVGWRKIADGPTTAYRDGPNGVVDALSCEDGHIPPGWHDDPRECSNCPENAHPTYRKVYEP